jgi:uncharacterized protein YycO
MSAHLSAQRLPSPAVVPAPQLEFGLHRGSGWIGRAIRWQTRSAYSHVSVVLPHGWLLEAREGRGVVVERWLPDVQLQERVDLVTVPCTLEQYASAMDFYHAQLGKRYDYSSVLRFVTRSQARRKAAAVWFCSELAFAGAQQAGLHLLGADVPWDVEPWRVSPGHFALSPLLRWSDAGG